MKRLLILFVLILLIGCGTANQDENKIMSLNATSLDNVENDEDMTEENEATGEDEAVVPTTRTVDTKNHYPWQFYDSDVIEEIQKQGERIFLWSDAEKLEIDIIKAAQIDTEDIDEFVEIKEGSMIIFSKILDLFFNDVEQYIDNEEYFNKLREAQEHMRNLNYETVVTLIEEAKQIRESE